MRPECIAKYPLIVCSRGCQSGDGQGGEVAAFGTLYHQTLQSASPAQFNKVKWGRAFGKPAVLVRLPVLSPAWMQSWTTCPGSDCLRAELPHLLMSGQPFHETNKVLSTELFWLKHFACENGQRRTNLGWKLAHTLQGRINFEGGNVLQSRKCSCGDGKEVEVPRWHSAICIAEAIALPLLAVISHFLPPINLHHPKVVSTALKL